MKNKMPFEFKYQARSERLKASIKGPIKTKLPWILKNIEETDASIYQDD